MYKLFTEDVHESRIKKILNHLFRGYTLIKGKGVYRGIEENSLIVELADTKLHKVREAAKEIKEANKQESVLLVKSHDYEEFV